MPWCNQQQRVKFTRSSRLTSPMHTTVARNCEFCEAAQCTSQPWPPLRVRPKMDTNLQISPTFPRKIRLASSEYYQHSSRGFSLLLTVPIPCFSNRQRKATIMACTVRSEHRFRSHEKSNPSGTEEPSTHFPRSLCTQPAPDGSPPKSTYCCHWSPFFCEILVGNAK